MLWLHMVPLAPLRICSCHTSYTKGVRDIFLPWEILCSHTCQYIRLYNKSIIENVDYWENWQRCLMKCFCIKHLRNCIILKEMLLLFPHYKSGLTELTLSYPLAYFPMKKHQGRGILFGILFSFEGTQWKTPGRGGQTLTKKWTSP